MSEQGDGSEVSAKSCSENGALRNMWNEYRKTEQTPCRLYKAYRGEDSVYEMPCKGSFKASDYCNLCELRKNLCPERPQKEGKNMREGMPCRIWTSMREKAMGRFWEKEPDVPRVATGIKNRVDRLKCLGNAVVPQQFYPIFKAIAETERMI